MQAPAELRYAGTGSRAMAVLVDVIVAGIPVAVVAGWIAGGTFRGNGSAGVHLGGWGVLLWALLMVAYYIVCEVAWGTSIGKRVLNLTVRADDGSRIGIRASVVRNLARFIDGFPYVVPYLVAAFAVSVDEEKQRIGDRLAHTVVVYRD